MKPIKAWAVVDPVSSKIVEDEIDGGTMVVLRTKALAKRWAMKGERVIPVMIVPVEKKK